jgi:hypothetical protein
VRTSAFLQTRSAFLQSQYLHHFLAGRQDRRLWPWVRGVLGAAAASPGPAAPPALQCIPAGETGKCDRELSAPATLENIFVICVFHTTLIT